MNGNDSDCVAMCVCVDWHLVWVTRLSFANLELRSVVHSYCSVFLSLSLPSSLSHSFAHLYIRINLVVYTLIRPNGAHPTQFTRVQYNIVIYKWNYLYRIYLYAWTKNIHSYNLLESTSEQYEKQRQMERERVHEMFLSTVLSFLLPNLSLFLVRNYFFSAFESIFFASLFIRCYCQCIIVVVGDGAMYLHFYLCRSNRFVLLLAIKFIQIDTYYII